MNTTYAFVLGRPNPVENYNAAGEIDAIDRFLLVKLIAARGKSGRVTLFSHRFKDGNDMALIEDINAPHSFSVDVGNTVQQDNIQYQSSGQNRTKGRNVISGSA